MQRTGHVNVSEDHFDLNNKTMAINKFLYGRGRARAALEPISQYGK